jgi:hypothetical protein
MGWQPSTEATGCHPEPVDTEEKAVAQHRYYDVTETVHYGYWGQISWSDQVGGRPTDSQQFTRVVTLPRQIRTPEGKLVEEPQISIERDPVRAAWPSA